MSTDQTGSRVGAVIACYIVPIPLEIVSTTLRIHVKRRQAKGGLSGFTLDDLFIIFATVRFLSMIEIACVPSRASKCGCDGPNPDLTH